MNKTVIGLDFGSDSVRALLVDASNGNEIADSVESYPRWAEGRYCNAAENSFRQHPLDYLESMEKAVRKILKNQDASLVAGIAVDTTGSTPCALDRYGSPLALSPEFSENPNAMFILWKDHTAIKEAAEINKFSKTSGMIDYTMYEGGIYSSEWFWAKILHTLRTDKKVREAAFSWVELCDWIPAVLSGNKDSLSIRRSRCAAGHKAMWHESWGGLPPDEYFKGIDPLLSGLRERLFKDTYTSDVCAGKLSAEWAKRLGLSENTAVGVGAFDCHFGAAGAEIKPGQLVKAIGTSTCDIMVAAPLKNCIKGICGQVDGSVIPGLVGLEAGQSAFGDTFAWFKNLLCWNRNDLSLAELEKEAASVAPGSNGVLALDWLNGRRTPDANQFLKGVVSGLNLGTTAPVFYRALIESTAFGAKRIIDRFNDEGVEVKAVTAIGGISKKSPFIMQLCADVFDMPINVVKSTQACALGSAMFAAVNAGIYQKIEDAMRAMGGGYDAVYNPYPKNAAIYKELYKKYCRYSEIMEKEIMNEHRLS